MNAAEQEALCLQYGLGRPIGLERAGGTRNTNCILQTSRGKWFVRRRYSGYSAPARVAFDHRAIEFLVAHDVPVAAPCKSASGDTFWLDNGVWEVFPAFAGRHLRDGDEADIRLLARALTQMHIAARTFAERFDKLSPRGETDPVQLLETARQICEQEPDCAPVVRPYTQWITSAARDLDDSAFSALPHTLVHGDIQPANILVHGDRIAAFVDFDWCAWRPRIYDLALAILLCCSTRSSPLRGDDIWSISQPCRVQPTLLRCFVQGCADAGWPLDERELRALSPQILLTWCSCRLDGSSKVEPSRWMEFLARLPHDLASLVPATFA